MSKEKSTKINLVEKYKAESNYLRGDIAQELVDGNDVFGRGSNQLLKHHGTYQQDDRDKRRKRDASGAKAAKVYSFMVRLKIPGGKLTCDQLLTQLDLCEELASGTLRITTRQGIQFHGIVKRNLRQLIRRVNEVEISTLAACGDVERNVMCCPAPHHQDPVHEQMQQLADQIAEHLCPRTTAYHEIWLSDDENGEKKLVGGGSNGHEIEPIYGPTYLPRKFKTAIGLPGDNCVDLYANDLGLMAICEDFEIVGYNVLVGGGFGVTPSAKKTFPAIAQRMAFITPDQAIDVTTAIVKVQRDHGNRSDRKVARLKYLIHNWGLPKFKAMVEQYYGQPLPGPRADDIFGFDDHLGWYEQGDGRWFYGLNVENGRIGDTPDRQIKSAVREICTKLRPNIRLTAHQSILFTDLQLQDRERLEAILKRHNIPLSGDISNVRRWSMACVAFPTCGLAITESERFLPGLINKLEIEISPLCISR